MDEELKKVRRTRKGQKNTPEHNAKISAALQNSPKHRALMAEVARRTWTGVPKSEEQKAKMRAAKLGKKKSPEHIAAITAAQHKRRAREAAEKMNSFGKDDES